MDKQYAKEEVPRDPSMVKALRREINRNSQEISHNFWLEYRHIRHHQRHQLKQEHEAREKIGAMVKTANEEHHQQAEALSRTISTYNLGLEANTPKPILPQLLQGSGQPVKPTPDIMQKLKNSLLPDRNYRSSSPGKKPERSRRVTLAPDGELEVQSKPTEPKDPLSEPRGELKTILKVKVDTKKSDTNVKESKAEALAKKEELEALSKAEALAKKAALEAKLVAEARGEWKEESKTKLKSKSKTKLKGKSKAKSRAGSKAVSKAGSRTDSGPVSPAPSRTTDAPPSSMATIVSAGTVDARSPNLSKLMLTGKSKK